MAELVEAVEQIIAGKQLLADGDVALVAVSGGLDSMALLHMLHALSGRHHWKLVVAHVNHRLRGRAANLDERFVARHAAKLGLRCEVARENVRELARLRKLSIEMAARQLRHDFLARTARALGIGKVFLAHHADDQVELFFLRLMRGSGTQGLGGMSFSAAPAGAPRIRLLRPLLTTWKSELRAYASAKKIAFREDATNDSTDILRNRVRHQLLPALRKALRPEIDRAVLRSMELVRDEGNFVTSAAMQRLELSRPRLPFGRLHVALQRRVIQLELLAKGVVPQFDHVEALRTKPDEWMTVGPDVVVRRTSRGHIERRINHPPRAESSAVVIDLGAKRPNSMGHAGLTLSWRNVHSKGMSRRFTRTEFFDAGKLGSRIVLRHWRPGDRFQPIGMPRAVKLQDLFVNQKIPRECRHKLVLATTDSGEVFWVEGLRIGENFKVTPTTKQLLEWRWRRKETLVAAPEGEC